MQPTPLLLPRPRHLALTGGLATVTDIQHHPLPNPRSPEHYRITITPPHRLTIESASHAALRAAQATYTQLHRQFGKSPPALVIEDYPAFPNRGLMLDISRDRVPTMHHLFHLVDMLAGLKFNHLQLYVEHAFAYAGHEQVWRDASPITPDELVALDEKCHASGITLASNQNCFGHLARWLRLPRYAPLAEIPDPDAPWTFEFGGERVTRRGPFSLCPTPPVSEPALAFVRDLLSQQLPCVRSGLVNIGCDETFDIGAGRSRHAVAACGRSAICCEFIARVGEIVRALGAHSMFWADMALADTSSRLIPPDMIALVWNYEPGYDFTAACEGLRTTSREVWVCPGTSAWRSITGRTHERTLNLREATQQGLAAGAAGCLITEWGDLGHHQQWPITLAALAQAADAAWTGGRDGYDPRAASLHCFGDRSLAAGPWLHALGDADLPARRIAGRRGCADAPRPLRNASALFTELHLLLRTDGDDRVQLGLDSVSESIWRSIADRLTSLANDRPTLPDGLMTAELDHTLHVATLAAEKALLRRNPHATSQQARDLADALAAAAEGHATLWLHRSRPGGLTDSRAHYDAVVRDLREPPP